MEPLPKELKKLPEKISPDSDLKELGKTISENYLMYHIARQQLADLQAWINSQIQLGEKNGR